MLEGGSAHSEHWSFFSCVFICVVQFHNCREIPGIACLFVYFTVHSLHRDQVKIHALPLLLVASKRVGSMAVTRCQGSGARRVGMGTGARGTQWNVVVYKFIREKCSARHLHHRVAQLT
jgi:hypothetical protein